MEDTYFKTRTHILRVSCLKNEYNNTELSKLESIVRETKIRNDNEFVKKVFLIIYKLTGDDQNKIQDLATYVKLLINEIEIYEQQVNDYRNL